MKKTPQSNNTCKRYETFVVLETALALKSTFMLYHSHKPTLCSAAVFRPKTNFNPSFGFEFVERSLVEPKFFYFLEKKSENPLLHFQVTRLRTCIRKKCECSSLTHLLVMVPSSLSSRALEI
jgi:hypothetical protein